MRIKREEGRGAMHADHGKDEYIYAIKPALSFSHLEQVGTDLEGLAHFSILWAWNHWKHTVILDRLLQLLQGHGGCCHPFATHSLTHSLRRETERDLTGLVDQAETCGPKDQATERGRYGRSCEL